MRKDGLWGVLLGAGVAAAAIGMSGAREAGAQTSTKTLALVTASGSPLGRPVNINNVILGGPSGANVQIQGGLWMCTIPFSSVSDAAAAMERIQDPKATGVTCWGNVTTANTWVGQTSNIQSATSFTLSASP
jgi:hypothetical protein